MARILFVWEFGQGFGHVHRLAPIAEAMRARGHDCIFAVPDQQAAHAVLTPKRFTFVPAARTARQTKAATEQTTPAAIVEDAGLDDPALLAGALAAWDGIFALVRPDLIVADLAPAACLASRGSGIPVAVVGNYTSVPTPEDGETPLPARMREAIDTVQAQRGSPPVARLADVFNARAAFVTTLPELDKRSHLRPEQDRCGPLAPLPSPAAEEPSVDYFAYLSSRDRTNMVLKGLAASGLRGSIMLRDARPDYVETVRRSGLTVHTTLRDLAAEIPKAALLIHHGGPGTMAAGMAVGRPQLIVANYREQHDYATAVARLGAARIMPPPVTPERVAQAVRMVLADARTRDAARALATRLAQRGPFRGAERIADALERLLRQADPDGAAR